MKILFKAAPAAVFSLTLLGGTAFSDAGFALGANNSEALAADTIRVDADILAADESTRNTATVEPVSTKILRNGDIVFTPGTGSPAATPVAEAEEEADQKVLTASSLAALVRAHGAPGELTAEERCLAGAVYFESKGESLDGQLAVARVVMARANSGRFPSTLCGVVYQPSQFSFVRGGKMPRIDTGSQHWHNAVAISQIALDNSWKSPVEGALFFHARYVSPGWRLKRVGTIDNHVFYR
jgi:hypothetical protein